jgi:hypothetical protein
VLKRNFGSVKSVFLFEECQKNLSCRRHKLVWLISFNLSHQRKNGEKKRKEKKRKTKKEKKNR